jgi:outer membrane protein assembly factor BamB
MATPSAIPAAVEVAWTLAGPAEGILADVSAPPAATAHELIVPMTGPDWTGLVCTDLNPLDPQRPRWAWKAGAAVNLSPAVAANTVFCIRGEFGQTGQLVALDRNSGALQWSQPLQAVRNSLAADPDSVYACETSDSLSRWNHAGQRLWSIHVGALVAPVDIQHEILVGATAAPDRLFAADRVSGKSLWQVSLPDSPTDSPVLVQDQVFVPTCKGIEIRSLGDGSLRTAIPGCELSAPAFVARDRFLGATVQGELLMGSLFGGPVQRQGKVKPGIAPLVGTNAVVYAADDQRLLRCSTDGAPEPWFAVSESCRLAGSLVYAGGRVFVPVLGRGLVCLKGREK